MPPAHSRRRWRWLRPQFGDQSQDLGDDFTVPLCRKHHRDLHDGEHEAAWWHDMGIEPLEIARQLWKEGEKHRQFFADLDLSDDKPKIRTVPDTPQPSSPRPSLK